MAPELRAVFLKGVYMVCPGARIIILAEIATPFDAVFTHDLISQRFHGWTLLIQAVYILDQEQDVDDRFGMHAGNGGAADVVYRQNICPQCTGYATSLFLEFQFPGWIVGDDYNASRQATPVFLRSDGKSP